MNPSILARRPARCPRGPANLASHHHQLQQLRLGDPRCTQRPEQQPPQTQARETQAQGPPRIRMPAVTPCVPRTVVVDDMVVAEDTDSDTEIIEDSDERDSDGESKPKVIKVITRKPPVVPIGSPEPAWHALFRRTPNSRTASIACSVPRARGGGSVARTAAMRPVQQGPVQNGHLSPSRIVNVPARVLVPRNRLVFPVATRGRTFTIGRQVGRDAAAPSAPIKSAPSLGVHGHGGHGRLRLGGRPQPQAMSVLGPVVIVSATGPLSVPEKVILDGVLDMQEEQGVYLPQDETVSSTACTADNTSTEDGSSSNSVVELMHKYGVSPCDSFHDEFLDLL